MADSREGQLFVVQSDDAVPFVHISEQPQPQILNGYFRWGCQQPGSFEEVWVGRPRACPSFVLSAFFRCVLLFTALSPSDCHNQTNIGNPIGVEAWQESILSETLRFSAKKNDWKWTCGRRVRSEKNQLNQDQQRQSALENMIMSLLIV
jgi:hypothetical protein